MWIFLVSLSAGLAIVCGHGRVLDPPGRGTAWRAGFNARANYDDDGLNCGGFYHQHVVNDGRCGLCGDPYDSSLPRAHERGGIYDPNIIVSTYEVGSIISITVQITAHHRGFWEFKLCPDSYEPDQDCFDSNPLELEDGGTKYYPTRGSSKYSVNYRLPTGLTCGNCVLQWRYTCGNNWGVCRNGTEGLGCGAQETFGACSDISIVGDDLPPYLQVDSLMMETVEEQDLMRFLINAAMLPQRWTSNPVQHQQRINSKKPQTKNFDLTYTSIKPHNSKQEYIKLKSKKKKKNKRKKKTAPFKMKWMEPWR